MLRPAAVKAVAVEAVVVLLACVVRRKDVQSMFIHAHTIHVSHRIHGTGIFTCMNG